jgi:hypothetical protein
MNEVFKGLQSRGAVPYLFLIEKRYAVCTKAIDMPNIEQNSTSI